jgi:hypothetical protein
MSTTAQLEANRANAQHSTGPKSEEGKAASCQNNFKHGFCGAFTVLPAENQNEFDSLLASLRMEHQPSTATENMLVDKLAEHFWLSQRAQLLQNMALSGEYQTASAEKSFALYLRYQTTNDRAFSKCLHDLLKLRAEKRKMEIGFERQQQQEAAEQRKQEAHDARVRVATAKAEEQELDNDIKSTIQARLPGHTEIPFRLFKHVLSNSIEQFAQELDRNPELAKIMKAA